LIPSRKSVSNESRFDMNRRKRNQTKNLKNTSSTIVEVESHPRYLETLSFSRVYLDTPQGISNYNPPTELERVIIRQNNTIIATLLSLYKRLENVEIKFENLKKQEKERQK